MEEKNKLCPHCKQEVNLMATRCPHCHGKMYVWTKGKKITVGIVIFIFLIIVINSSSSNIPTGSSSSQSTTNSTVSNEPQLELLSYRCYDEYDYFQIVGQVKNISDQSLKNVEALGTAYTKTGEFVNSSDSLIDYNPILPGQKSSFKVMMTDNPEMKKCTIEFKYLMGGNIDFKNSAK